MDETHRPEIETELRRILASSVFSGSERHRRFLEFVVRQTLDGAPDSLNEFTIGFEVFQKSDNFDPRIDSIVRVEARRLRDRLKKYYAGEGANDPVIINLRPRGYVPSFELAGPKSPDAKAKRSSHHWSWVAASAVATAVISVVAFAAYLHWGPPSESAPATDPVEPAILVLPFENLAPDPEQGYLSIGLAEALISDLTRVPGLRVISLNSTILSTDSKKTPLEIASSIEADYVVAGTVQSTDQHIRVSAKLTDVKDSSYIWAHSYDRPRGDLIELEQELALAITSQVRDTVAPGRLRRASLPRPASREAHTAFLKGINLWYQDHPGSIEKSVEFFQTAIDEDPNYALAWAWLAQGYHRLANRDDGSDRTATIATGRKAALKALELDNELAEAHAALASYDALDWQWDSAGRGFQKAIELNPGSAIVYQAYVRLCLLPTNRLEDAIRIMLRTLELDPLNRELPDFMAMIHYARRDYPRSVREYEDLHGKTLDLSPPGWFYFLALEHLGQVEPRIAGIQRMIDTGSATQRTRALLGYLLARTGKTEAARSVLKEMETETYVSPLDFALVYLGLEENDEALRQLNAAVERHHPRAASINVDPVYDPVRNDPRFVRLLEKMDLNRRFAPPASSPRPRD